MDSYQAIYDAVRSRVSGIDVGGAVESALREANLGHYADMASRAAQYAAEEHSRPCVMFKPAISLDGTMWCALYGDNLMDGVAGFGETPALAMAEFDKAWLSAKTPAAIRLAKEADQ